MQELVLARHGLHVVARSHGLCRRRTATRKHVRFRLSSLTGAWNKTGQVSGLALEAAGQVPRMPMPMPC